MPSEWKSQLSGLRRLAGALVRPSAEATGHAAPQPSPPPMPLRHEPSHTPRGDSREDVIRDLLDAMPLSAAAHLSLGRALREAGRNQEAIAAYRAALALDPSAEAARAALRDLGELTRLITAGDTANRERRWPEALRFYAQALQIDPGLDAIWVQYGHAIKETGIHDVAELAYRRALALRETPDADLPLQLGHVLKLQGRLAEALDAYLLSAALDPESPHARREAQALQQQLPELASRHAGLAGSKVELIQMAAVPVSDLDWDTVDGVSVHHTRHPDPQMRLDIRNPGLAFPLPAGEWRMVLELNQEAEISGRPRVYFDEGYGFSDDSSVYFEPGSPAAWFAQFTADFPIRRIRLDPSEGEASFIILRIDMMRIGPARQEEAAVDENAIAFLRSGLKVLAGGTTDQARLERSLRQALAESLPGVLGPSFAYEPAFPGAAGRRSRPASDGGLYQLEYNRAFAVATGARDVEYAAISAMPPPADRAPFKAIAYYLPQMHRFPENDLWWGRGFTEWTNVSKAIPQFEGHYQPRLPGELGFYDLLNPDVMRRQIELAKLYGVHGFCFHYYWFAGHRLLERPIENFLADPTMDFPFCLCWANENWTRRWDGAEHEVLMQQTHTLEDHARVFDDLLRYFRDPRYIRIDGKPVITIYRPSIIANVRDMVRIWRERAEQAGLPGLYMVATTAFGFDAPEEFGFDALAEFPPHGLNVPQVNAEQAYLNPDHAGIVYRYEDVVRIAEGKLAGPPENESRRFPAAFPGWDNEARKPGRGHCFHGARPSLFHRWFDAAAKHVIEHLPANERLVFINAWNEWGEGAYLEPDRRFGYANLAAVAEVICRSSVDATALRDIAASHNAGRARQADTAVCLHLYYADLLEEFAEAIAQARLVRPLDVIVSVPVHWAPQDLERAIARLDPVHVLVVENRGRDVYPFLQALRVGTGMGYRYGCKIHSKKSLHLANGAEWRRKLVGNLLSPAVLAGLADSFFASAEPGLAAKEESLMTLSDQATILHSEKRMRALFEAWDMPNPRLGDFVAGTMFWFGFEALGVVNDAALGHGDFEPELGQIDGTTAHALERMFLTIVEQTGRAVIRY